MTQIELVFHVADDGSLSVINQAKSDLMGVESAATSAAGSAGGGGLGGLVSGAADLYASFSMVTGVIGGAVGVVSQINAVGDASRKANESLSLLSNGNGDAFLAAGRTATRGLVDDLGLAQAATSGLARGAFTTSEQFARIAADGTALGVVLGTDATSGINSLEFALESVGNNKSLKALNLDVQDVDKQFKALTDEGVNKTTAWRDAVLTVSDAMAVKLGPAIDDGPGAAVQRLGVRFDDFKTHASEAISVVIDKAATAAEQINTMFSNPQMQAVLGGYTTNGKTATENSIAPPPSYMDLAGGGRGRVALDAARATQEAASANAAAYAAANAPTHFSSYASEANVDPSKTGVNAPGYSATGNAYQQMLADNEKLYAYDSQRPDDTQHMLSQRQQYEDSSGNTYRQSVADSQPDVIAIQTARDRAKALQDATAAASADMQIISIRAQAVQDATQKERDHAAAINSVASAFGLNQNGLYGQVGNTADQGVQGARAAELAKDQHKGMGAASIAKDMAAFDKSAQQAADAYALATGGATKESLAFRDAQASASKALADGKITVTQYYTEMQKMADIAKTGKGSVEEFYNAAHPKVAAAQAHSSRDDVADQQIIGQTAQAAAAAAGQATSQAKAADLEASKQAYSAWLGAWAIAPQVATDIDGITVSHNKSPFATAATAAYVTDQATAMSTYLAGISSTAPQAASDLDTFTKSWNKSPFLNNSGRLPTGDPGIIAPGAADPGKGGNGGRSSSLTGLAGPLGAASGTDMSDPFAGAKTSADKAKGSVDALGNGITTVDTNIGSLAGAMPTYGKNIAAGFQPAQSAIDKAVAVSKILSDMWGKMNGHWTMDVNFTAGGQGTTAQGQRAGVQYQ